MSSRKRAKMTGAIATCSWLRRGRNRLAGAAQASRLRTWLVLLAALLAVPFPDGFFRMSGRVFSRRRPVAELRLDFQLKDFFQFFLFQLAQQKLQGIAIALADFVELNA